MSEWISAAVPRIHSSQYIRCVKIRAAALYCRLRASRWNPQAPRGCDEGCQSLESLGHMIQKCPRTDGARHERHNVVMKKLENELIKRGYKTRVEPRIPTDQGLKIPDLCAWKENTYIVCDVAVTSDIYNLDRVYDNKVLKYDTQDVHSWMLRNASESTLGLMPNDGAFVCNWRGVMFQKSFIFWKDCGVTRTGLMNIVTAVLNHSYKRRRAHRFTEERSPHLELSLTLMVDALRYD